MSEHEVCRGQILTSKDGPRAERVRRVKEKWIWLLAYLREWPQGLDVLKRKDLAVSVS